MNFCSYCARRAPLLRSTSRFATSTATGIKKAVAKSGVVHIVHHIDTEGPLHEPLSGTFSRIEQLFGITIDAPSTRESLQQMRSGKLLGEDTSVIEGVKKLLDPRLMSLYPTW